jgi:hypothetical protein
MRPFYKKNINTELEEELKAAEMFLTKSNKDIIQSNELTGLDEVNQHIVTKQNMDISHVGNFKNDDLYKYRKQLRTFGFPDFGNLTFETEDDKIATLQFFDFVIRRKGVENEERTKFKKQIDALNNRINTLEGEKYRLEKEIITNREDMKRGDKDKKDSEGKVNKFKDGYEKQISELKTNVVKLQSRNGMLVVDKKNLEERINKLSESYNKVVTKGIKANNGIEVLETLKKNDVLKCLSKIKGTEKLLETLKSGFNESVRELLFEITALKNFIYEINKELQLEGKQFMDIESTLLSMPFLDTVGKIKYIVKTNLYRLKDEKVDTNIGIIEDDSSLKHSGGGGAIFDKDEEETCNTKEVFDDQRGEEDEGTDVLSELEILKKKWVNTLMK